MDKIPNWETENWQNLNRQALANLGPFRYKYVETVAVLGLAFSLSALCKLYVVIV